ncbi:hypothetical protein PR048_023528 [Dryococelus australis]|uniref:Thioredoxin domain-containing protein n=1 Tax=Dryococelus australis TaxID=614101 RepID=A0ABQ9GUD7_9NEOP|nr:hypothetical protein PR048_023528 [Dryococelus australis]
MSELPGAGSCSVVGAFVMNILSCELGCTWNARSVPMWMCVTGSQSYKACQNRPVDLRLVTYLPADSPATRASFSSQPDTRLKPEHPISECMGTPTCPQLLDVRQGAGELEKIDDDTDTFGVDFVKINDKRLAKHYGIKNFPALTYFREKEPIIYEGRSGINPVVNPWSSLLLIALTVSPTARSTPTFAVSEAPAYVLKPPGQHPRFSHHLI